MAEDWCVSVELKAIHYNLDIVQNLMDTKHTKCIGECDPKTGILRGLPTGLEIDTG
jgi:hypothetical protein